MQFLGGKHVRLRGTISKGDSGRTRRERRSFAGHVVTMSNSPSARGTGTEQIMLPSVMVRSPACSTCCVRARFLSRRWLSQVPKPPPQAAEKMRTKDALTPRAALVRATEGLTPREIALLEGTEQGLPSIPAEPRGAAPGSARYSGGQASTVNLFSRVV